MNFVLDEEATHFRLVNYLSCHSLAYSLVGWFVNLFVNLYICRILSLERELQAIKKEKTQTEEQYVFLFSTGAAHMENTVLNYICLSLLDDTKLPNLISLYGGSKVGATSLQRPFLRLDHWSNF